VDEAGEEAIALVRRYLAAMEARDLAAARLCLDPGFRMTFPGGATFDSLEALVAWSRPRYRSVAKRLEGIELAQGGAVVWCFGTLFGEWPDGRQFEGVRFVDRFEIRDGRLADQKVWNDLAEARA
jgi:hypothetical protein